MPTHYDENAVKGLFGIDHTGFVELPLSKGDTAWNPKTGGKYHGPCTVLYQMVETIRDAETIIAKRERGGPVFPES